MAWIRSNISNPTLPSGQFDTGKFFVYNTENDNKRTRVTYGPSGAFNSANSLTGALDSQGRNPGSMNKNLESNQTQFLQYINIPRFIIPLNIPTADGKNILPLYKSLFPGDIFFHLRATHEMFERYVASPTVNTLHTGVSCVINLQTLNYILYNAQNIFDVIREELESTFLHRLGAGIDLGTIITDAISAAQRKDTHERTRWVSYFSKIEGAECLIRNDRGLDPLYVKLILDMEKMRNASTHDAKYTFLKTRLDILQQEYCSDFVSNYMSPGGIFVGSENQGGSAQEQLNPCSHAPTDYIGTLQVAGKARTVRNLWAYGKDVIPHGSTVGFQLVSKTFEHNHALRFRLSSNPATQREEIVSVDQEKKFYMLVPSILDKKKSLVTTNEKYIFWGFGLLDQYSKRINCRANDDWITAIDSRISNQVNPVQILMRPSRFENERVHLPKAYLKTIVVDPSASNIVDVSDKDTGKKETTNHAMKTAVSGSESTSSMVVKPRMHKRPPPVE